MKNKQLVLMIGCFITACSASEKEFNFKNKNGTLAYSALGKDINNACYTEYYEGGEIRRKVCLKDSLKQGLDQSFNEKGILIRSSYYQRDTLIGLDTFFHENGKIDYLADGYGEINGKIYQYNSKGLLDELILIKYDNIYYSRKYIYRDNLLIDSTEAYKPVIEVNKDSFDTGDTAWVHFYLPPWIEKIDYDKMILQYEFIIKSGENEAIIKSEEMQPLGTEGVIAKFKCSKSGKATIIGRLKLLDSKGKERESGITLKEFDIK